MSHHVQFPTHLSQDKIDVEPHPVDAVERPVLGLKVPGIEHHVLAVVQLILRRKTLLLNGNASQPCLKVPAPDIAGPLDHFVGVGE
ncbi:hypothetical protein [Bradyrhizobium sp. URHC0002]